MTKQQRQEAPEQEHSHKQKPDSVKPRRKQNHREITHYFSKVPRPQPPNPHIPTPNKPLLEELDQQTVQLQQRQKYLLQKREELHLKLQTQQEEHGRLLARFRNAIVHELKSIGEIDRTLAKQREEHIWNLQSACMVGRRHLQSKKAALDAAQQGSAQRYFLMKDVKNAEAELKRVQHELAEENERYRLSQEEENCYLAKECWPILGKKYQSLRLIGKGGFSEVYQAYDLENHRPVAVKLSEVEHLLAGRGNKADYLKHIKREYEVHKHLSHPNIVRLLEVLEVDSAICIVLDHCEGPTLSEVLRTQDRLPQIEAKMIARQLLSVIVYLSSQRIVHYDLKPQNIMFQNGIPKVLDFGICKIIDSQHSKMALTSQGVGTYCYLPPQTFASSNPLLSNKVDIWSLGVIFYEMLYGFRPGTMSHELNENGQLIFPRNIEVSQLARSFIQGCLKSSLRQRFDPFGAQRHAYFQSQ